VDDGVGGNIRTVREAFAPTRDLAYNSPLQERGDEAHMNEDLRKRANDLLVSYAKMQNRLAQAGVNDTGGLVTLFSQLSRGLDAISIDELDPAIQEVNILVDSLRRMQADLQVLKELKMRMARVVADLEGGDSEAASGDSGKPAR
jgi:hypothetical protein